jgi:hypothetical protein
MLQRVPQEAVIEIVFTAVATNCCCCWLCREGCGKGQCPAQPRFWDPLFAAVYRNADKIDMQVRLASLVGSI